VFLVLLLLSGILCALYLHSAGASERGRQLVESIGSALLAEEVRVQRFEVQSVLPPAIRLQRLSIHSEESGQPLVSVDEVQLRLDELPRPWNKRVAIRAIQLKEPSLRLAIEEGEIRDYRGLVELLQKSKETKNGWEVQLGTVSVEDGSLRLSAAPQEVDLSLSGLDLDWSMDRAGDGSGNIGIESIELGAGGLRESGKLTPFNFDIDSRVVTLRESKFKLFSTDLLLRGEVRLPDPPGAAEARPITHTLDLRATIDLPKLEQVIPSLPPLEGTVSATLGLSDLGEGQRISFSVQGHDVLVHMLNLKKPKVFKVENPSLIGVIADGKLQIEEESVLLWGGGRIEPKGHLILKDDFPFDIALDLNGLQLDRALDSSTVPGSWVSLELTGTATLQGRLKEGFEGRGSLDGRIKDLEVRNGAWDSERPTKRVLFVPRASIKSGIFVDKKHLALAPSVIRGPRTKLNVSTKFLFGKPLGLDIEVRGKTFDVADLSGRISQVRFEGDGGIEAHIVGPSNNLDITGQLELEDFVLNDWAFGRVSGDVHWKARGDLEFTSLRGRRGRSDFESEVRLLFPNLRRGGDRRELLLSIDAVIPQGHGFAEDILPIFFKNDLGASGPIWGTASLAGPSRKLSGSAKVWGEDVTYLWEEFAGLEIDAEMREGVLDIRRGWASKPSGNGLAGSGWIAPGGDISFDFKLDGMELNEMAPVRRAFGGRSSDLVELAGGGGPWVEGRVSGYSRIGGNLKNIEVDGKIDVARFNYRGTMLGDSSFKLTIEDHVLEAKTQALGGRVEGELRMDTVDLWRYDYHLTWNEFDVTPFLPRTILGQADPIRAQMSGRLEAEGTLRDRFHHAGLLLERFSISRKEHAIHGDPERGIRIGYRDGALRFDDVHFVSPEGAAGRTDFRISGFLRPNGPLDLQVNGAVDLAFIDFAYDVFDRAEAQRFDMDLKLAGRSTAALEIEGDVNIEDALLKTVYFPHAVEVKEAQVEFRENRLTLKQFEGQLGGGQLEEVAGSYLLVDRSGYRPRSYALKANCVGCTIRYPDFLPPATGDLRLQFNGDAPDDLLLSGQVHIEEMVLRDPLNWQRSVLTFRSKFTETLASVAKRSLFDIELFFDSEPEALGIRNNIGDLRGTAREFRVLGDTQHVVLEGGVEIEGGTIPYSGHNFQIEPGFARFRDRESWFPELELRMWTDVDNRDETYRISYEVSGPLDAPKLRGSAEPQLAETDINLLLLFGLTQEQLAEAELGDVVLAAGGAGLGTLGESTATSLGQSVAGSEVGALIPDRIEIVPVYTDTTGATTVWTVATKEVVPGLLTLEGGFGLGTGRNMTVPTVLRAQVGFRRNIYLEGSWIRDDAASKPYGNFGVDLKFELDLD